MIPKLLLVSIILSLSNLGDSFLLPIETIMQKERNPLDMAFRGFRPRQKKTENVGHRDVGFFMPRHHRQPYSGLILRGEVQIV